MANDILLSLLVTYFLFLYWFGRLKSSCSTRLTFSWSNLNLISNCICSSTFGSWINGKWALIFPRTSFAEYLDPTLCSYYTKFYQHSLYQQRRNKSSHSNWNHFCLSKWLQIQPCFQMSFSFICYVCKSSDPRHETARTESLISLNLNYLSTRIYQCTKHQFDQETLRRQLFPFVAWNGWKKVWGHTLLNLFT